MKEGDKVTYTAPHGEKEKGIIKSFNDERTYVFVVYNCNNDWNHYQNYTGQCTNILSLELGWN